MRIAAGVILIVAAIFNVIAGAGYAFAGGVATVGGDALQAAAQEAQKEAAKSGATADDAAKVQEGLNDLATGGATIMYFGFFLLLLFVLQIICAIMLFLSKAKMFIFVVAALSILAEIGGVVLISFGFGNIFGLLGGILAFVGAMGIGKDAGGAAPAAPAEA